MTSNSKHKADRKHRKHIEDETLVSQKNRQTLQTFIYNTITDFTYNTDFYKPVSTK